MLKLMGKLNLEVYFDFNILGSKGLQFFFKTVFLDFKNYDLIS